MAKVMMFPQQKKTLPKGLVDYLHELAKDYVAAYEAALILMDLEENRPDDNEVLEMVRKTFSDGIYDAFDELGKDLSE